MSAITVGGDLVHYEVLGRGRPVILVHGWIGSWRYWVPAMQQLLLKYRVYALDLYGFGDTSKNQKKYTLDQQVQLLTDFMHQLAIPKAALVGHSLGALVVAEFARRHQEERVPRLVLVSPPLFDPGDLQERVPAGHRVMLTGTKPLPPLPTTPAPSAPSQAATPATATPAPATSAQPAAATTTPAPATTPATPAATTPGDDKKSDSVQPHESTIPSASTAMRAALMEAARVRTHADAAPGSDSKMGDAAKTAQPAATPAQQPVSTNQAHAAPPPNPPELKDTSMLRSDPVKKPEHNPLQDHLVAAGLEKLLAKCFKTSQPEYEKLRVDLGKTDSEALKQSVEGFDSGRVLDTLRMLRMPTVIIHGADDPVIPQPSEGVWNYITVDKEDTLLPILLPGVRHFPMLEHERFLQLITDFLESPDVSKLEIKERWKRRTR